MLKDLGRGGIRLQRPQAAAVRPVFRPSLARVPPNTASSSRPSSVCSSDPLPISNATTAPPSTTTATTAENTTSVTAKPKRTSVLSFDAQALESDEEDDSDDNTNSSRPETVASLLEEEEETQTQPLRSSLEETPQHLSERTEPTNFSSKPGHAHEKTTNIPETKSAAKSANGNGAAKTNTATKSMAVAKGTLNPQRSDGNENEEAEEQVGNKKKTNKKVVEKGSDKNQQERKASKRKNLREGEGDERGHEGEVKKQKNKEADALIANTKRKKKNGTEKAEMGSEKTPTPKKSKKSSQRKKKEGEEDEEEEENSEDSDYEDEIKPKRKSKVTEKKARVIQKRKANEAEEEDDEEGKIKSKVVTPLAKKKFETHKPIEQRTLRAIINDHYSGEVSASSLREKSRREAKQDMAKVEELDESVAKEEKGVVPRPASRNQEHVAAPQVQIVDGKVVISQESLAIHADVADISGYTHVEEIHRRVTGATYSKRIKALKWTEAETEVFFRAIAMYGTDFTFVSQLLPRRSRKEVRNKFKREQSANSSKIDAAMMSKTPMDFDEFEAALERVKKEAAQDKATSFEANQDANKQKDEDEEDDDDCVASEVTTARARPQSMDVNSDDDETTTTKTEAFTVDSGDEGVEIAVDELEADLSWAAEESFPEIDEDGF